MLVLYDCQDVGVLADEILGGAHVGDRPAIGIDPRAGVYADDDAGADHDALARRRPLLDHPATQRRMTLLRIAWNEYRADTLGLGPLEQNEIE